MRGLLGEGVVLFVWCWEEKRGGEIQRVEIGVGLGWLMCMHTKVPEDYDLLF
jgi:hypothetical protein